jgi:hypothetical protein
LSIFLIFFAVPLIPGTGASCCIMSGVGECVRIRGAGLARLGSGTGRMLPDYLLPTATPCHAHQAPPVHGNRFRTLWPQGVPRAESVVCAWRVHGVSHDHLPCTGARSCSSVANAARGRDIFPVARSKTPSAFDLPRRSSRLSPVRVTEVIEPFAPSDFLALCIEVNLPKPRQQAFDVLESRSIGSVHLSTMLLSGARCCTGRAHVLDMPVGPMVATSL